VAPSAQAISYALSIDEAYPSIQSMLVRGTVMRPDLGFIPVTVTPSIVSSFNLEVDRGVLAVQLEPAKPGAQAGLSIGDVITAVDNVQIYNVGDFWHVYLGSADKAPAQLTVFGKNGQVAVALPRLPSVSTSR
jgi:serine protease Do